MAKSKGKSKFAGLLKKFGATFKKAEKAGGGGSINENVEEGRHEAKLIKAEIVEVSGGTKAMVAWTYEFEVDKKLLKKNKQAGWITDRTGLETEQNAAHLKRRLAMYGYDVDELEIDDLPDLLAELTKKQPIVECVVKLSSDEQWQNVLVNKVVDEGSSDDDDEEEEDEDDEEEEDEDEEDEEEADDEEEDEDEEEDGEDEPEFAKGDKVMYKPPKARKPLEYTITAIKNGKATLKDEAGGLTKGILLEKLEAAAEDDADDEDGDDEDGDFAEVEKGSKLEVTVKNKSYKAVAVSKPNAKNETVKVRFESGNLKGQTKEVDLSDCELLD